MTDEAPPSSDRRRAIRHVACFPGHVEHSKADEEKITAMISDLAETGTLILMRTPDVRVGDELRLELHVLLDSDAPRHATGRVVRIEPLPEARAYLWTHQVAVDFHERLPLSAEEIDALAKRQAAFGKQA